MDKIDMDLVAAVEARFEAQNIRIAELKKALRDLAMVPAVAHALGNIHTAGCRCPLCVARGLIL